MDALKAICGTGGPSQHDITTRIATIEDIRAAQHRRFGKVACVLPGLERIIECSYSDYQRDKVLFRTHPAVKRSLQRRNLLCKGVAATNQSHGGMQPAKRLSSLRIKPLR